MPACFCSSEAGAFVYSPGCLYAHFHAVTSVSTSMRLFVTRPLSRRYVQISGEGRNGNACISEEPGPVSEEGSGHRTDTQRALLGALPPRWLKERARLGSARRVPSGFQFPAENPAPSRPPPGPGHRRTPGSFILTLRLGVWTAWAPFPGVSRGHSRLSGPCPPPLLNV